MSFVVVVVVVAAAAAATSATCPNLKPEFKSTQITQDGGSRELECA